MKDGGGASYTANAMCVIRAHGAMQTDPRLRNPDHLARQLCEMPYSIRLWPLLRRTFVAAMEERAPGIYYHLQARTREFDAILLEEIAHGAKQFVLLGAGFDSRAYRFAERLAGTRVFEVDHPATSVVKRKRLKRVMGTLPSHVVFVPMDVRRDALHVMLHRAGFDPTRPAFFLGEGFVPYLEAEAVKAMLAFVGRSAPGSSIAFDFMTRPFIEKPDSVAQKYLDLVQKHGEPFLFGVDHEELGALLGASGMDVVQSLTAHDLTERHLVGSDGSVAGRVPPFIGIARGRVRPRPTPGAA